MQESASKMTPGKHIKNIHNQNKACIYKNQESQHKAAAETAYHIQLLKTLKNQVCIFNTKTLRVLVLFNFQKRKKKKQIRRIERETEK